jgi:hypothetical protein
MTEGILSQREGRLLGRYVKNLHKQGVNAPFDYRYLAWAERFVNDFSDCRLADVTAQNLTEYFTGIGRKGRLKGWQFRQQIDSIRLLYDAVDTEWSDCFDWAYWDLAAREEGSIAPKEFEEWLGEPGFIPSIRAHSALFARAASVMDFHEMSIRTEQSYLTWVCRFIHFNDGEAPETIGATEVLAFVQNLVKQKAVTPGTQNHALNALLFLYDKVLELPLGTRRIA